MKAIVYSEYGSPDVLRFTDVATPTPRDNEVLIKIHAAALNALDWRMMRGKPLFIRVMGGLRKPKANTRPGVDFAGVVESVGKSVTQWKPGDEVFGAAEGACAEYVCVREDKVVRKPPNVSFEQCAGVPVAALTALQGLRNQGRIQRGQRVLIDGASGGVGTFTIQIAKSFGTEVTAVCSTKHVDTARSLGADHVIDYTRADFTRSGKRYDLILAANAHRSILDYRRALGPSGICVLAGGGIPQFFQTMFLAGWLSLGRKKMRFFVSRTDRADLEFLAGLLAAGTIVSVIDRRFPLGETVDAVRYLEEGHARGKVIIAME
jgi:NADPH:quinone reductase-like Zn-dependent oxidoreductase